MAEVMPPGPALDAWVAENVMGWTRLGDGEWRTGGAYAPAGWSPSTMWEDAGDVIEALLRRNLYVNIRSYPDGVEVRILSRWDIPVGRYYREFPDFPHSLCLACHEAWREHTPKEVPPIPWHSKR